jgi:acetoin utilization transport system permease protein
MFNRALWKKHYKQTKYILWSFWFITLFYPINIYFEEQKLQMFLRETKQMPAEIWGFAPSGMLAVFQMLCLVVLAAVILGLERSNHSMDFTLSLPYKRKDILLSKWAIGVVTIVTATVFTMLITLPILLNSLILSYFSLQLFFIYFATSCIFLIGIYSFSLFIGLLVGSHIPQFIFTWIFLFLPYGLYRLASIGYSTHYDYFTQTKFRLQPLYYSFENLFETITIPLYFPRLDYKVVQETAHFGIYGTENYIALLMPIVLTSIFLLSISFFAKELKSEKNGKILLYKQLEPLLIIGTTFCFYLLGGFMLSSMIVPVYEDPNIVIYHVGAITFAFISLFIITKLLGKQLIFKRNSEV